MSTFAVINAVVTGVNVLTWSGVAWMGLDVIKGIENQHAAGYPNRAQLIYYLASPLAMTACALALYAVGRHTRFRASALLCQTFVFCALPLFLFAYTGGV